MSLLPLTNLTISAIQGELLSAITKHGREQTPLSRDMTNGEKLAILVEELGEVGRELTYDHGEKPQVSGLLTLAGEQITQIRREKLIRELLQLAAMAAAWAQCVDEGS